MPLMLRLTLPAIGHSPSRVIAVAVQHIVTVSPRHIPHPDDKLKPMGDRRWLIEGTWVETTAHVGSEESSTFHVQEDFEVVMGGIPED